MNKAFSLLSSIVLLLALFTSCGSASYTETEITPSNNRYIGILCDQNDNLHCFSIKSVENYLDTYFTEKEITHYILKSDLTWDIDTCEWLNEIVDDFPFINGKSYNIALTYYQDSIYAVAAMGEYKNDFYYGEKNILYVIESSNIIYRKELKLPTDPSTGSVPYAPKIYVTGKYIALQTLSGICLLDQTGNTLTDTYTVAKIDALTNDIALAEYNPDYVEILNLPTFTSQGLFEATDSYRAYFVDSNIFYTFTSKGIFQYVIDSKRNSIRHSIAVNEKSFQFSNEKNQIIGGAVSKCNDFYVAVVDEKDNVHLYKYSLS